MYIMCIYIYSYICIYVYIYTYTFTYRERDPKMLHPWHFHHQKGGSASWPGNAPLHLFHPALPTPAESPSAASASCRSET